MKRTRSAHFLLTTAFILLAGLTLMAGTKSAFAGCVDDGAVTKVADVPTAFVGDTVIYTITVFDDNDCNTINADLTDTLPTEMTFVSLGGTDAGDCSEAAGTVDCTFTNILTSEVRTFTIQVTVNGGEGTTVTNTAVVTPSGTNQDPNNDQASADVQILAVTPSPIPTPTLTPIPTPTPFPPTNPPLLEGNGCALSFGAQVPTAFPYGLGGLLLAGFWTLRKKLRK